MLRLGFFTGTFVTGIASDLARLPLGAWILHGIGIARKAAPGVHTTNGETSGVMSLVGRISRHPSRTEACRSVRRRSRVINAAVTVVVAIGAVVVARLGAAGRAGASTTGRRGALLAPYARQLGPGASHVRRRSAGSRISFKGAARRLLPRTAEGSKMHALKLTPPRLAFVIVTRALLAAGVGLLVAGKLPDRARRLIGSGLIAFGAITTFPAIRTIAHAAR